MGCSFFPPSKWRINYFKIYHKDSRLSNLSFGISLLWVDNLWDWIKMEKVEAQRPALRPSGLIQGVQECCRAF
jgi:hypothetical protein